VSRPALGLSLLLLAAACGGESPTGVDLGSHQPEGPLYRSGGSVGAGGLLIVAGPGTGAPFEIVVDASELRLDEGDGVTLAAKVVNPAGNTVNGNAWTISFASTNAAVFTVTSGGVVTAVDAGTADLVLTAQTLSKTIPVTVLGHPTTASRTTTSSPAGTGPFGLGISPGGAVLVSLKTPTNAVLRGDLPSTALSTSIPVGSNPTGVTPDFLGTEAFVTNQGSNTLGVIDLLASPNAQVATVALAGSPFVSALSPDGATIWVTLGSTAKVALVDRVTRSVITNINVGSQPNGIAFHGTQPLAYVSNSMSGTISVINTNTNTVTATLTTGGKPQGMGFSRNYEELYVANESLGRLEIWNTSTGTKITDVALGGQPFGVAVTRDDAQVWVTDLSGKVHLVDRVARTFTTTTLGGKPRRLAFDRFGGTAVIANETGWVDYLQ
jgi:YVTN family beta-propeller protein